jgi:putative membrane protein
MDNSIKNKGGLAMEARNIIKCAVVLIGAVGFATVSAPARATGLQAPDSDALIAGYQLIQFNLKECLAIAPKAGPAGNGSFILSPGIRRVASDMCAESREYQPKLEALAKSKGFELPDGLPTYLNARYAALIRNQNGDLGQQYLEDQISSHEDAVAIFQEEVATGNDPDVKAAANEVLPIMQANLAKLKKLRGQQ